MVIYSYFCLCINNLSMYIFVVVVPLGFVCDHADFCFVDFCFVDLIVLLISFLLCSGLFFILQVFFFCVLFVLAGSLVPLLHYTV